MNTNIEFKDMDVDVIGAFEKWVSQAIDEEGVFPFPGAILRQDGGLEIIALDLSPVEVIDWFWRHVATEQAREVVFGLDRNTKKGQGTEFNDVLTLIHWKEGLHKKWNLAFRIGVINYQHEPRIVRPIDWNNDFWKKRMTEEIMYRAPKISISTRKK